jgi:hypothetical protein
MPCGSIGGNTMKLKENELKVYYEGNLNQELDKKIRETLKKFGYSFWASGMSCENIRDLSFCK